MRRAELRSRRPRASSVVATLPASVAALMLAACAGHPETRRPEPPTLASLASRPVAAEAGAPVRPVSDAAVIAAYREVLASTPGAAQRALAQRRLGDLSMDAADRELERGAPAQAALAEAIARYEAVLKEHPEDPSTHRVLYQLARAHEQRGDPRAALVALDRLVARRPAPELLAETQFRRGELLFSERRYAPAEQAFEAVVAQPEGEALHARSRYMAGWSQYQQGRTDEALRSFMAVLDGLLGGIDPKAAQPLDGLGRAQREWVDDTLRVIGLSLQQGAGTAGVAALLDRPERRAFGFVVYERMGELLLSQDRVRDAAESFAALAARDPQHPQAARLQARVIDVYAAHGFERQALDATRAFVALHGDAAAGVRNDAARWATVGPLLRRHLLSLARYHHARAVASRPAVEAEVRPAEQAYRRWLDLFGDDAEAGLQRFMLGELMTEAGRWDDARAAYELAAYAAPPHPRQADAGYAAVLASTELARAASGDEARSRAALAQARRFVERFGQDPRGSAVLADAARRARSLGDGALAVTLAQQASAGPGATPAIRRDALAVLVDQAFDAGRFADAERQGEALAQVEAEAGSGATAGSRQALAERVAAAIHRQGEQARDAGDAAAAAAHFDRAAARSPGSRVAAAALFDRAVLAAARSDWTVAVERLTALRREHAGHPLAAEVPARLATAWLALDRPADAAEELVRVAQAAPADSDVARSARWQAAQLLERSGRWPAAQAEFERLLAAPLPGAMALEVRARLLEGARRQNQSLDRQMVLAEALRRAAEADGSERARALGARARLVLAEPARQAYAKAVLAEPLARALTAKKARLEAALQALAGAATDAPVDVVTEATWRSGQLYADFGRALLAAPRPRGLRKAEAEQYAVMLEEQAFPFEEKAAELFEANARRTAAGVWDDAVRGSIAELARLRPARWARRERVEAPLGEPTDALLQRLREAVVAAPDDPKAWNALGVASRQAGRFDEARQSYERAAGLGGGHAPAVLNLAILDDLYLRQPARALAGYERFQSMLPGPDPDVTRWIAELRQRKPDVAVATAPDRR